MTRMLPTLSLSSRVFPLNLGWEGEKKPQIFVTADLRSWEFCSSFRSLGGKHRINIFFCSSIHLWKAQWHPIILQSKLQTSGL